MAGVNRENRNSFSRARVTLVLSLLLLALKLFSQSPRLVEQLYSNTVFPFLVTGLDRLNSRTILSISEIGILLFLFILSIITVKLLITLGSGFRQGLPAALRSSLTLLNLLLGVVLVGYVLWGLNYSRPPLDERIDWAQAEVRPLVSDREELGRLAVETIRWANHFYRLSQGHVDTGEPSHLPESFGSLDESLNSGMAGASAWLGLPAGLRGPMGPAKPLISSRLMSYLGLSGFYSPWTGEANFNDRVPDCELPIVIAHEKAHQRGFAGEDEASFAGFLACLYSDSLYARYSAYLFAQRELLREWMRLAPREAQASGLERLPGVQRDLEAVGRFWNRYRGVAWEVTSSVNDAYLKLHRVKGGILSYQGSARLLVLLGRHQGGFLSPPAAGSQNAAPSRPLQPQPGTGSVVSRRARPTSANAVIGHRVRSLRAGRPVAGS